VVVRWLPGGGWVGGWWWVVVDGGRRLARDEGSEAATDEEAADDEAGGVVDEHDSDNEGTRQEEAEGQALAGAHHVAHGTHDKAREDGARDRRDVAYVEVVLAEFEVALDVLCLRRGGGGRGAVGLSDLHRDCSRPPRLTTGRAVTREARLGPQV